LSRFISIWPRLPEHIRQAILLLVSGCESTGGNHAVDLDESSKHNRVEDDHEGGHGNAIGVDGVHSSDDDCDIDDGDGGNDDDSAEEVTAV
jgi:hypothetical protein